MANSRESGISVKGASVSAARRCDTISASLVFINVRTAHPFSRSLIRSAISVLLICFASVAIAQQRGEVRDLQIKVSDLVFRTESFGGGASEIGGLIQDLRVRESPTEVTIELAADVLFEFDKAELLSRAAETLGKAAAVIEQRAKGVVRIEGHTDSKGDDAYNMRLSERRASSVRNWFSEKAGLANIQFTTAGRGETKPVAPNQKQDGSDDPEGRQKNRRVEIVMPKGTQAQQ